MSAIGKAVGGIFGGDSAAKDAARAQMQASRAATAEQRRQFDITQQNYAPFLQAGETALGSELAMLGLSGQEAQQQALQGFSLRPDQQFIQGMGEQALLRNAAATGGLQGGNVLRELQSYGQGTASQALGEQLNRLASLRGGGQTAVSNLAQIGSNTASAIGNNLMAGGQAQAQGILGAQQANAALGGQFMGAGLGALAGGTGLLGAGVSAGGGALLGLLSDIRFKENIRKVGELDSGIGWYTWDWKESVKDIVNGQPSEGVLAQEVMAINPEAVMQVGDYLMVDYARVH